MYIAYYRKHKMLYLNTDKVTPDRKAIDSKNQDKKPE